MQLYTYKIQTSLEWLSVRGHTTFPALLVPQKPTGGAKVSIIQDYIHNNQPVRIFLSKIFTKQNCNIIHRMASVHSSIDKYCRVCGGLLQKKKKQTQYSCATHREKLKETFEIDTSGDDSDIVQSLLKVVVSSPLIVPALHLPIQYQLCHGCPVSVEVFF